MMRVYGCVKIEGDLNKNIKSYESRRYDQRNTKSRVTSLLSSMEFVSVHMFV